MSKEPETVGDIVDQLPAVNETTPMSMIAQAVAKGAPIETVERLLALQERWEANEARKAYVSAMSSFKSAPPTITKNKQVSYESKGAGSKTAYKHATLDHVCDAIGTAMARHGLSFRWETMQADGGLIKVTCIITHNLGHSERTFLQATPDTSGSKNHVQAIGSTTTYLQRYTLLAATGLATEEQDDDAERGDTPSSREPISTEQIAKLQDGLDETGSDIAAFCKHMGVQSLAEILLRDYHKALSAIEAKRKKAGVK